MTGTCLHIDKCDWYWCKTNGRCLLFTLESPKSKDDYITFYQSSLLKTSPPKRQAATGKKAVNRKSRLKNKLTPFIRYAKGGTIELSIFKCHYCKKQLTYQEVTVDHKLALSNGGSNNRNNLLSCCSNCNQDKGSKSYEEYLNLIKTTAK